MPNEQVNFEWAPTKAAQNIRKHGVSFERAASIFRDPEMISLFDSAHSEDEERWLTLGLDSQGALLVVSHTRREKDDGRTRHRISRHAKQPGVKRDNLARFENEKGIRLLERRTREILQPERKTEPASILGT